MAYLKLTSDWSFAVNKKGKYDLENPRENKKVRIKKDGGKVEYLIGSEKDLPQYIIDRLDKYCDLFKNYS